MNIDHNFFSIFNSQSLYWAGFIVACGSLSSDKKKIKIELAQKDSAMLYKFSKQAKFNGKIEYYNKNNRNGASILITSKTILNDLSDPSKFGIDLNNLHNFPKSLIDNKLINHFIRGYFDGNGSFYIKKLENNIEQKQFDILGTKDFLETCSVILNNKCGFKPEKIYKKNKTFCITTNENNTISKISKFLYKDSNPQTRMLRKYNIISKPSKVILGLDLSLNGTGFAILNDGYYISSGKICPTKTLPRGQKLSIISSSICDIIEEYLPEEVVIENIFVGRNVNAFKALAMVHGTVINALYKYGFYDGILNSITASEARNISKSGKTKENVFDFIIEKYKLNFCFDNDNDRTDAILLSLARHYQLIGKDVIPKKKRKKKKKNEKLV